MLVLHNNQWTFVDSVESHSLIDLPQYVGMSAAQQSLVSGIFIDPSDDVQTLGEGLKRLKLIVINFPKYTDGQGYTHARILRTQLAFSGEIRASGDIRPDQLLFMIRAGINSFNLEETHDENKIQQIISRYVTNYQPSYALPNTA